MTFDLLVRRARIYDGSGQRPFRGDVGVLGDRIAAVGPLPRAEAGFVLDADGLALAPGFIDPHNHANNEAEGGILNIPGADNMLRQGVTTLIAGNCGGSAWPIGEHLDAVAQVGIKQNYATLVGHSTLRSRAVADGLRAPTPEELQTLRSLARQALDEGAFGISTGYFPAWVTTDELVAVSQAVAEGAGIYTSHIRNEGPALVEAVAEAIEIGRRAQIPIQISHIKAHGRLAWDRIEEVLALLDGAADIHLHADCYPYTACFSGIAALIPAPVRDEVARRGGLATSLQNPAWHDELVNAVAHGMALMDGPRSVIFAPLEPDPELQGKTVAEVAEARRISPEDLVLSLAVKGGMSCVFHAMREDNLRTFLSHRLVMFGSDGHLRRPGHGYCHPRNYGTFPRAIGRYGRDARLYDLSTAIRKASAMAADKFGLTDRGYVRQGYFADLVLFSEPQILDTATFQQPHQYPQGIKYVLVNGALAVDNERTLPGNYGRVLRFSP